MDPAQQPADGAAGQGPPDSPFGDQEPGAPPESAPQKAMNYWGLRNTEPHLEPRNVGRQLDLAAEWYEHLFCGFMKQSSSGGTEAWMHYVVALLLLADRELGLLTQEERDELDDRAADALEGQRPGWDSIPDEGHDES